MDESDFALVAEDLSVPADRGLFVAKGRVWDKPLRHRSISIGEKTRKVAICLHGRLRTEACGLCEYEAPRLGRV